MDSDRTRGDQLELGVIARVLLRVIISLSSAGFLPFLLIPEFG
jgi:hypothetical protein